MSQFRLYRSGDLSYVSKLHSLLSLRQQRPTNTAPMFALNADTFPADLNDHPLLFVLRKVSESGFLHELK